MEASKKKKIILSTIIIVSLLLSFGIGVLLGQKIKHIKISKNKFITFYQVKKHINEETNDMEKNALKLFVVSYERCLKQELTAQETQQLTNIQTEVLALSKGNDKIKFKISDLASAKGAVSTVKKTRKCQKQTYKHMTKTDRRLLKKAISKLSLQTIVSMYHGIR